jgi:uncharacterized cupin superfamily protein
VGSVRETITTRSRASRRRKEAHRAGRPTLRTLDGLRQLEPGDVVACRVGPRGAHQLQNTTDEPVRALVVSTMAYPEVAEQLDSDKVLVHSPRPGTADRLALAFPREAQVDRLAGELRPT